MQFSALRYFLETARLGSIRRASEVLYVAPSAISRQIAQLEQSFGAPLFERHALGVRLTAAGEVFARQARMTIKDFERLRGDLDDLQQLRRGNVRISSMEGAVPGLLFGAIWEFEKDYPGTMFEIVIGGSETQVAALVREECDISITFNIPPHPEITIESSFADPVCAIVHPNHPFARRRTLRLAELTGQRIVMLDRSFVTRTLLETALASEGLTMPAAITINHIGHAITYVVAKMGMTFVPRHIVQNEVNAGLLKAIPLQHPILEGSKTSLCRHRSRPPTRPAQAFFDVLHKRFAAIAARHRRTSRAR